MKKNQKLVCGILVAAAMACGSVAEAASKPVIGLSNAYYGNTWRHQMVTLFKGAADKAKADGEIGGYYVANADGSPNQQIAQIGDLILKGVNVLIIDPASEAALNSVIQKACQAGITVVAFDAVVSAPCAYNLNFNFDYQIGLTDDLAKLVGDKGNVLLVRGLAGSSPDAQMYAAQQKALAKYPDLKVVGSVYGNFTASVAQAQVSNILPTLAHIDLVLSQGGGDDYGIAKAFDQSPQYAGHLPVIGGGGSSDFIRWWAEKAKDGYKTESANTSPGIVTAAMWYGMAIHDGAKVPRVQIMPAVDVTQADIAQYVNLPSGEVVAPTYDKAWVDANLLKAQ